MNEEVERLQDCSRLATHRHERGSGAPSGIARGLPPVLPHLEDREDELAQAIRDTCSKIEARLTELGAYVRFRPAVKQLRP
jgi:hypothetical protein